MNFEFAAPPRILFGPGSRRQAGPLARELGKRALVVTGAHSARADPLRELLAAHGVESTVFSIGGEPTTEMVRRGTAKGRDMGADWVMGFGGGSPLDAAKAVAALLANGGDPLDYMEVVGKGLPLAKASVPCIAIPTTAGTGSEVTRNAVLASPEHGVKASMRSWTMIPRIAIVDPELTYDLPPEVTARTGLDALTQLIEPFTCNRANPLVDALCREGIARVARSLRKAWADGRNAAAREDMSLASLFGGFALANAGLGAVHGFAGVVGGMFNAPHGAVCAALLPHVMAMNRAALQKREPQSPALARYDEIARLLTGQTGARAEDGVEWIRELTASMGVPALGACGVAEGDIPTIAEKAAVASGTQANPILLDRDELAEILKRAS
ncbi:MAG: iron-containing alcohol dehydrogenase [Kiritimatiellia bacterium]